MSSRQAVVLASRVLCVYLLFWVVNNLIDLPSDVLSLHQRLSALTAGSLFSYDKYLFRYYSLRLEALILKTALELFFAGVLYRCGPRVIQFLTGEKMTSGSAESSSAT
jgi:hypothetical protein